MTTYVSTGELPGDRVVRSLVDEAHEQFRGVADGAVSTVYPALARAAPERFGLCVVGIDGSAHAAGDADVEFDIMSVAKPFVFALVAAALGTDTIRDAVGVDATGLPFDSLAAIERDRGLTNPMVNAGAIVTTSLVPGATPAERWSFIQSGLSRFAGRDLTLDDETYESASATNRRNRAIVHLLDSVGRVAGSPVDALDLYTRQSCLRVTARDLAVMGATLADGGVNPITGEAVVDAEACRCTLVVMAVAGMYETSGRWLYDVGLPARAASGAASSPSHPARVAWGRSPRSSMPPATACAVSSRRGPCRAASGWTCSRPRLPERVSDVVADGERIARPFT